MRLPRLQFSVMGMMLAAGVVAILLLLNLDWLRRHVPDFGDRLAAHHREVLASYPMKLYYRTHIRRGSWRSVIEECREAEEYLRVTPRRFEPGGAIWTDMEEGERRDEVR